METQSIKKGDWVSWKADYEMEGKVLTNPDKQGWVDIQGPDEETSDGVYNVHISQLTKED